MRHRVRLEDAARSELLEAREFYRLGSPGRGRAFGRALTRTFDLLATYPAAGLQGEDGTRAFVLTGFPYLVVYRVEEPGLLTVIAVAHTSREPGYWRDR